MSIIKNKIQRSRKTYEERFNSQSYNTNSLTSTGLNNFERFSQEQYQTKDLPAELKLVDHEQVFDILQKWINWNSSVHPRTLDNYWSKVKSYLHYRGIKLHPMDIKQELRFPHKIEEELYGLTLEDIHTIFKSLKYKYQVLFTCQSSSLMRIGEMLQLRKKDLDTDGKNIIVHLPAHITKLKRSRTTFFSIEASRMLRPRLKELDDDDLVFTTQIDVRNAVSTIEQVLRRALIKSKKSKRYESNGQYQINTHSFRAYGITKIARVDENLSKKFSGQKGYMLQYDRLNDDEKLEIYKKCEIDLLIDKDVIQKAVIRRLTEENKVKDIAIRDSERFNKLTENGKLSPKLLKQIVEELKKSQ